MTATPSDSTRAPHSGASTSVIGYVYVARPDAPATATQESLIHATVARHGWKILDLYVESGGSRNRLESALARLESGAANRLVIAEITRIGRDTPTVNLVWDAVRRADACVHVCDLGKDVRPDSLDLEYYLSIFSANQRELLSRRIRAGLERKRLGLPKGTVPTRTDGRA